MKPIGILLLVAGWLLPVTTLPLTQSNTARLVLALVGVAITLAGIVAVLIPAHLKNALWKTAGGRPQEILHFAVQTQVREEIGR